jgi:hypothetical protein
VENGAQRGRKEIAQELSVTEEDATGQKTMRLITEEDATEVGNRF